MNSFAYILSQGAPDAPISCEVPCLSKSPSELMVTLVVGLCELPSALDASVLNTILP